MAMQKHAMLVVKKAIDFINPGQIPVIVHFMPIKRNVNGHTLMRSVNQNGFLHGVSAHPNSFTRMWGETAGWICLETDVLPSHRFHPWCCNISGQWSKGPSNSPNQRCWGSLVSLKAFCISQTQSTGLNIQSHQLLNKISFSNNSKLCVTLSVKVKL